MVIIDMEMPKGCASCNYLCKDYNKLVAYENPEDYKNKRLLNCPLKEYPENKDMSWEELKQLAKDEIVFEHKKIQYFEIDSPFFSMQFYKIGLIYFNDTKMFENKKPFEMWQIIKALTGEK